MRTIYVTGRRRSAGILGAPPPAAGAGPPLASFIADHSEIPIRRPRGIAVDLRASDGMGWSQGGTTFTLSGVSGTSILTKIVDSGTTARLVISTGSSTGTLTISDGTNTATVAVKNYRRTRWFRGL